MNDISFLLEVVKCRGRFYAEMELHFANDTLRLL